MGDFERQVLRYRRLLVAYPRSHRLAYGPAMVQLFSDRLRHELSGANRLGLFRFWIRMLADLGRSALAERTEAVMNGMRRENWWLAGAALIAAVQVVVVVGSWVDRFTNDTVTLFADGTSVRIPADNGPLYGHLLFTGVIALGAVAIIVGLYRRTSDPQWGHRLMLAGSISALAMTMAMWWFPPSWLVAALAVAVAIRVGQELSKAIEVART